ncbi:MAG TPA: amidohydrolase family protein [Chloroflexota bacterium]|nr:amidohydrolase family protein [Chloroflexota bacterium]
MARTYRVVSADSHLDLNPEVWTNRVPAKWRDRAPKRIVLPNGSDAVQCDGGPPNSIGITRNVGVPFEEIPFMVPKFSEPVGNGTPQQRIAEMDRDGVDAEILFTWADQMFRNAKDDDLYLCLVSTYNEYLAEEYMSVAPDRLIPQGTIPTTGVDDAIRELEHCKRLGFKGVTLTTFPSGHGYPTAEDDRFWAAAVEMEMALARHFGGRFGKFGGPGRQEPVFKYPRVIESPDNHKDDALALLFSNQGAQWAMGAMQLAYAGVFDRFPTLQMYFAETMAGWIPFCLFMLDDNYRRYQPMMRHFWGLEDLERMPSEYMKEHTYWGTLYDPVGIQLRDAIGADRIMFGTDFPHAAGDWPNTQSVVIPDMFRGVPQGDAHKILAGNAVRYWHLDKS